jgi:hypothetical protein
MTKPEVHAMHGLLTIHDLCRMTGLPPHVVNHAIRRHGPEPQNRIGLTRVWERDQLELVLAALRLTGAIQDPGAGNGADVAVGDRGATPEVIL